NVGDIGAAQALLDPSVAEAVTLYEAPINDAWFRDSGPTFLTHPDGRLGATHWTFNAWGHPEIDSSDEAQIGAFAAGIAGAELFSTSMVNEGGGIHVDGEGTVLMTHTVQLDPFRNPDWLPERAATEVTGFLGAEKAVWVPRGLTVDYEPFGTRGHIDIVAAFVRPGVVVAHAQLDPTHPDFEVCAENLAVLRAATDAKGRRLEVIEIPAPVQGRIGNRFNDWSYINHYVCNGAVILCSFDDPNDEQAAAILGEQYPDRAIVLVDAQAIFECGGGIHCITQQQPAVQPAVDPEHRPTA
ncbi:MAG: agmatine deiminase family protein, partial [Rhodococcus sp. (in: high G+C Gram-positive bacteria)]